MLPKGRAEKKEKCSRRDWQYKQGMLPLELIISGKNAGTRTVSQTWNAATETNGTRKSCCNRDRHQDGGMLPQERKKEEYSFMKWQKREEC